MNTHPLIIRGYYKVSGGTPSVVGSAEPQPREGMELLLDDEPPEFDHWPLEEGDEIVVTRRAPKPIDAGEA
jgi:hypothetical protein